MKPRTRWTSREELLVFEAAVLAQNENSRLSDAGAMIKAQELALPPERQMHANALYMGKSRLADYAAWKAARIASPPDEPPAVTASDPVRPEPECDATPADTFDKGISAAVSILASTIAIALRHKLEEELSRELGAFESDLMARLVETGAMVASATFSQERIERLPRVLIVSLRGQQGPELRKEFEGLLRVQWVESGTHDAAVGALRNFPGHVVCMAKFISHSDEAHFKKHPRHRTIHGGMSELREALLEIATEREVS